MQIKTQLSFIDNLFPIIILPSCKHLLGVFLDSNKTSALQAGLFLIFKDNWKHTENVSNFGLKLLSPKMLDAFVRKCPSDLGEFYKSPWGQTAN